MYLRALYILVLLKLEMCVGVYEDRVTIDTNIISQDDRRAAEFENQKTTELQTSSPYRGRFFIPPSYEDASFDPPGSSGQYLPPYHETGSHHHGGYGFYPNTESDHHSFRAPSSQGGSHSSSYGGLALKGLLIPLAGIALLGAAAALSTNPVLLQLGVLSGRRKRSISEGYPVNLRAEPKRVS